MENLIQSETANIPQEEIQEITIEEKVKLLEKKKKRFQRRLILMILVIIGFFVLVYLGVITKELLFPRDNFVVVDTVKEESEIEVDDPVLMNVFDNETFKLKLTYSRDNDLKINKGDELYENNVTVLNSIRREEDKILEGYYVKITLLAPTNRSLEEAVEVKKSSMKNVCPEASTITSTYTTMIGGLEGRYFAVRDCEGDYIVNYVTKFGMFYEIEQFFKGDVGYVQKYKADSFDIVRSIEFYPEEVEIKEKETFDTDFFSFEYPSDMSRECCKMDDIPGAEEDRFLNLGYEETKDTISVSIDTKAREGFNEYVDSIKQWLIDDYIIVRSAKPILEDISMKVGDRDAVLLSGYTWQGYDLVIFDASNGAKKAYGLVGISNVGDKGFDAISSEILKSFRFK